MTCFHLLKVASDWGDKRCFRSSTKPSVGLNLKRRLYTPTIVPIQMERDHIRGNSIGDPIFGQTIQGTKEDRAPESNQYPYQSGSRYLIERAWLPNIQDRLNI